MDRDIEGRHRTARGAAGDRELLALFEAGDGPAGQEIVARYERLVGAAARRVLFAGADVDDVVQETFLALLLHAADVRDPDRLGPWLWTTATNLARRTARRNLRHRPVEDIEERLAPEADAFEALDLTFESDQHREALRVAMGSISSEEAQLIRLLTMQDRPCYASISKATCRPVGSIGPTRARILGKLRAHPAMARIAVAA